MDFDALFSNQACQYKPMNNLNVVTFSYFVKAVDDNLLIDNAMM